MNILTFDIEEWFIEKAFKGDRVERYDIFNSYLEKILSLLDETDTKATFFCVGRMAVDFPEVVKKIAKCGHEIGCHSNVHTWINKMSREEALEDTHKAVDSLEQCIGSKILSYRAPAFSIGESNKWAFEILTECGIARDSSVFPAARDFGGFPNFEVDKPSIISFQGIEIKEYPISIAKLLGKKIAYSGGGYFRFFPLWFVKKEMKAVPYSMCYFHIGDLLPETDALMSRKAYEDYFKTNGSLINRYKRYFKSNFGKKNAWSKLQKLVKDFEFKNLEVAYSQINWDICKKVILD